MKKLITITAALGMLATSAFAVDLPNKKAAPATPTKKAALCDSVALGYGQNFETNDWSNKNSDAYALAYTKCVGPFTIGGAYSATEDGELKQNLEAQAGVKAGVGPFVLGAKVGVGQRFTDSNDFPYYAAYGTADYRLNDDWTINALEYRYRNAFDVANNYESHRLGTGATYRVNETYSINAKVYRDYDKEFNSESDGVMIGLTIRF